MIRSVKHLGDRFSPRVVKFRERGSIAFVGHTRTFSDKSECEPCDAPSTGTRKPQQTVPREQFRARDARYRKCARGFRQEGYRERVKWGPEREKWGPEREKWGPVSKYSKLAHQEVKRARGELEMSPESTKAFSDVLKIGAAKSYKESERITSKRVFEESDLRPVRTKVFPRLLDRKGPGWHKPGHQPREPGMEIIKQPGEKPIGLKQVIAFVKRKMYFSAELRL
mmetsp:Transcript_12455/g.19815  ORF Transcript_12455/g.19815 Transcript_12455/m.19815 type:complete len:225 (-) Transcript_12455:23-697(-)